VQHLSSRCSLRLSVAMSASAATNKRIHTHTHRDTNKLKRRDKHTRTHTITNKHKKVLMLIHSFHFPLHLPQSPVSSLLLCPCCGYKGIGGCWKGTRGQALPFNHCCKFAGFRNQIKAHQVVHIKFQCCKS